VKRVAAVVAAVTMIVVSLFIRSRLDDDNKSNGDRPDDGGRPVVACVTELADACQAAYGDSVELRVEDARTTATALAKGSSDLDAWVTMAGWPELLSAKGIDPPLAVTPVASTPLVLAAVKERVATLACASSGWSCFLDSAGKQWGDLGGNASWGTLRVGINRSTSASGLLLQASAVAGVAGTADVGTNDVAYTDARQLLGRVEQDADAFGAFAVQLPARFSAVGALQADVNARSGTKADLITTIALTPAATATAVVARVANGQRLDPTKLAKPLTSAGWTTPPAASTGLPDGGVLLALSGI
jgi:hypothetical protein